MSQMGEHLGNENGGRCHETTSIGEDGERIGRYLIIRDVDGRRHAVGAGSVTAITETDAGSLLLLPGGRLVQVPWPMEQILRWLDGRS